MRSSIRGRRSVRKRRSAALLFGEGAGEPLARGYLARGYLWVLRREEVVEFGVRQRHNARALGSLIYLVSRDPTGRRPGRRIAVPCYLFTYHAYGSWMPDHRRGYVQRGQGVLPPDRQMAERYRTNMAQDAVSFDTTTQQCLAEETVLACEHQQMRCHFLATERTHLHVLVSWRTERKWQTARAKLRESLTRRLNREFEQLEWFSKSPSRKRVRKREHFDYLVTQYLPRHAGWKWSEERGLFR